VNLETVIQLLYGALALDAVLIAIPAFINWRRLRQSPDFKYFALRAALTALSHVLEAVSLVVLLALRSITAVWIVLAVWQLGELMKVVGEWGLVGSLFGMLNGIHPSTVVHSISPAMGAPAATEAPAVQVMTQKVEIANKDPINVVVTGSVPPKEEGTDD
jgi:hypothetical protein